jgi:hypothetical protein
MIKTGMKRAITWHKNLNSFMEGKFLAVAGEKLIEGREQQCEFVSVDGQRKQSVIWRSTVSDPESREAWMELGEINEFYEKINELRKTLNSRLSGQPCTYGKLAAIDVDIVYPPAGVPYNKIYFDAGVRAFRLYKIVETKVYELDNYRIEDVISEIIALANAASEQLKERFETGNF